VNAMILAAGRGTRLGRLGSARPKVLLDVADEPLLARHLRYLEREGIQRVIVNAHHCAEQISAFTDGYRGRIELVTVLEQHLLGTAGGVRNALSLLEPGPFLVLYGDVLIDEPLGPLLSTHRGAAGIATITVHEADDITGKGVVSFDPSGRVTAFVEKAPAGRGPAWINSGVYVLESELIAPLPRKSALDFGHDVFPHAVELGLPVYAHPLRTPVIDVGTFEGLALARAHAEAGHG
jgi:mannose-1-phosphate guanylyltransferase